MSDVKVENLTKNTVKLTVTVSDEEIKPFLEIAAEEISQDTEIPGFRPGKASFEAVKKRVGEMKIYEAALERVVRKTYIDALEAQKLDTVGEPKINVEKMAPENDLVYTVEVALMPEIKKLADWKKLTVDTNKVEATEEDADRALKDLARMQTKEVRQDKDHEATKEDKAVINMNMKQAGVPVEGGQAVNNMVVLGEDHYIPGFCDELLGLREGDKKTFILKFPENHYQKNLAGADVEFEVTINEIYKLDSPKLDDKFAASLGQKDMKTLKDMIKQNIQNEKDREEQIRQERAMLDMIAEKSEIEEIPEQLVNEEIHKMVHELQHAVTNQGGVFEDYLKSIGKTLDDMKKDFAPEALKRIKVALVVREIAKNEDVQIDEKEVDAELDKMAEQYEDKETQKKIYSPGNREYVSTIMRNRKVIDTLRETMIK